MRILILSQWFQPEPHFKGMPLAKALMAKGHVVEVLTGFPNYPGGVLYPGFKVRPWQVDRIDGVRVTRGALYPSHDRSALGRIFNYVSFALSTAVLSLTLKRPDVVYVYTPPMTAAAAAVALKLFRRVPFVVDVQDLWPDTLAATGMVNSPRILKLVGLWTDFVFRRAARIMVLSPGFKHRLEARGIAGPVTVIPNWAPPEITADGLGLPPRHREPGAPFNILFAGNMGRAQGLDTVLAAATRLRDEKQNVCITFIGGGVDADELGRKAAAAGLDNVRFLPKRHPSEMRPVFADADALLVHLRDDPLFEITIPSKTQAYLAIGRPILMGVRGDAADMVTAAEAGIVFEPENVDALVGAIKDLAGQSEEERARMGAAGTAFYQRHLAFGHGVEAIEALLAEAARS